MLSVPETLFSEVELLDKGIIPKPRMAVLIPTYSCNQKCYYCFFNGFNHGFIPTKENILNIVTQLKKLDVKAIELCGGGEPLMTPSIDDIAVTMHDMGFSIGLLTNGVFFKDNIADIFLKYATYVRFSLDTVSKELYKKVRGSDDLDTVLQNIKSAIDKKMRNNYICDISIKIGLSKYHTKKDIEDVFKYFNNSGLSNIQVKHLWDANGTYFNTAVSKDDLSNIYDYTTNIVRKLQYAKFMQEKCWLSPIQLTVDGYGDVYLCCYYMYRKETHKICNIFNEDITKVWGSEKHKELIKNIKTHECLKHDCRLQKYMRTIRKNQKKGIWNFV